MSQVRAIQAERFKDINTKTNARMPAKLIKIHCNLNSDAETILQQAMISLGLSACGYTKILKVARTIADLDNSTELKVEHVSEALQYRNLDRAFVA